MENECIRCINRLKIWSLVVSLFLSLMKAVVGILGSCEAIVADGLYSLYQSLIVGKSIFGGNQKLKMLKTLSLVEMVINIFLVLGIIDVVVFSIVRIVKASKGLLVDPSPYAIYAAVLSILANQIFYKYSLCINKAPAEKPCKTSSPETVPESNDRESILELSRSYRLSIIISTIVVIGVTLARICWLYADALSAVVVAIILTSYVIRALKKTTVTFTDLVLLGKT